jgi:hypothetical protein
VSAVPAGRGRLPWVPSLPVLCQSGASEREAVRTAGAERECGARPHPRGPCVDPDSPARAASRSRLSPAPLAGPGREEWRLCLTSPPSGLPGAPSSVSDPASAGPRTSTLDARRRARSRGGSGAASGLGARRGGGGSGERRAGGRAPRDNAAAAALGGGACFRAAPPWLMGWGALWGRGRREGCGPGLKGAVAVGKETGCGERERVERRKWRLVQAPPLPTRSPRPPPTPLVPAAASQVVGAPGQCDPRALSFSPRAARSSLCPSRQLTCASFSLILPHRPPEAEDFFFLFLVELYIFCNSCFSSYMPKFRAPTSFWNSKAKLSKSFFFFFCGKLKETGFSFHHIVFLNRLIWVKYEVVL